MYWIYVIQHWTLKQLEICEVNKALVPQKWFRTVKGVPQFHDFDILFYSCNKMKRSMIFRGVNKYAMKYTSNLDPSYILRW